MHIARRDCRKNHAVSKGLTSQPSWYRLRSKEWEFFVSNEVEAFAVLARHDIEDIELMRGG